MSPRAALSSERCSNAHRKLTCARGGPPEEGATGVATRGAKPQPYADDRFESHPAFSGAQWAPTALQQRPSGAQAASKGRPSNALAAHKRRSSNAQAAPAPKLSMEAEHVHNNEQGQGTLWNNDCPVKRPSMQRRHLSCSLSACPRGLLVRFSASGWGSSEGSAPGTSLYVRGRARGRPGAFSSWLTRRCCLSPMLAPERDCLAELGSHPFREKNFNAQSHNQNNEIRRGCSNDPRSLCRPRFDRHALEGESETLKLPTLAAARKLATSTLRKDRPQLEKHGPKLAGLSLATRCHLGPEGSRARDSV